MSFDELADFVAIFVGHDDVTDDDIRTALFELTERTGCVTISNDVDVLATEGDLDHLAHGCAVVNKIDRGCTAHDAPPAAKEPPSSSGPLFSSSNWRNASSIRSVGERKTVRVTASAPGINL